MRLYDGVVFVLGPAFLLDFGVEVVVPALPALFADAAGKTFGDEAPVFGAVFLDQSQNQLILQLRLR